MSAAKGYSAAVCLIIWCTKESYLNRIVFICNIYNLCTIAKPVPTKTIEGIDDLCLLLYGAAVGNKDYGIRPIAQYALGINSL